MKLRTLGLLIILLASSTAFAQENLIQSLFNIDTWVDELGTFAQTYQQGINSVAYALLALGLVVSLIGVARYGNAGKLYDVLGRLLLSSAVISLTPAITTLSVDTWESLRQWSGLSMAQTYQGASDEMQQLALDTEIFAFAITGPSSKLLSASAKEAAVAAGQGAAKASIKMLNWMLLPIATLGLIGHFILLGSGLTIILACIFLPVSAGIVAFSPEQGGLWIGRVVAAIVGALLVTAFMPIIFKSAFELTVVQPLQAVNAEFAEFGDYYDAERLGQPPNRLQEIETELATLETQYAALGKTFGDRLTHIAQRSNLLARINALEVEKFAVVARYHVGNLDKLNNALASVSNEVMRWASRLLFMFIGVFMGSALMWWGARATVELVGGIVGREVGRVASMGGSQLMGFARGGGNRVGTTSPGSQSSGSGETSPAKAGGSSGTPATVSAGVSDGGGRQAATARDQGATFSASTSGTGPRELN